MNSYEYLYTASYIVHNLSTLCVVIASIVLFSKKRVFSTTLILIGSVLMFLFGIGNIFINVVSGKYGTDVFLKINAISNIVNSLAYFLFSIGLLIFAITSFKKVIQKDHL